jgi:hypothetical protein
VVELFFSVRLERDCGRGFLVGLVAKLLDVGVNIFQPLFKGLLRTTVSENYFPLIDDDLINPVTEGLLCFRLWIFSVLLSRSGEVQSPIVQVT